MFKDPICKTYYCYGVDQPLYDEMKRELSNIVFFEGLPPKQELETWYIKEPGHKLLIIDDLMTEASTSKDVVNIYCKYAHHFNFLCILVSELQIQTLGRQIFPRQLYYFMEAYRKATEKRYRYLLVDLSSHSDSTYKLRTNIIPGQTMILYTPEKKL